MASAYVSIRIDKSTRQRIIRPTLQVVEIGLGIEVIASVAEGVQGCDIASSIGQDSTRTPGIIAVPGHNSTGPIDNANHVALQVPHEEEGLIVEHNAADCILGIINGGQYGGAESLPEDLAAVQDIAVRHTVDSFAGTDTVCVVGIGIAVKGLQLPTLFPDQGVTKVIGRIALGIVMLLSLYPHEIRLSI